MINGVRSDINPHGTMSTDVLLPLNRRRTQSIYIRQVGRENLSAAQSAEKYIFSCAGVLAPSCFVRLQWAFKPNLAMRSMYLHRRLLVRP